ncbi:mandelate racemase/muconate lactonizing enzyme family protein [Pelagicoccus mobilis]|uniref:Mandelate racemase/muconate lactonizing enzyme family protein n=1 Tax=Pelagicoccus mobilis TaxID=415221 RepID=A0A934VSF0_9BACT|nr:mandelate racemase/muconate lactonizing enzyme family protein [Pelagicoccus mobilis]MBK1878945.1 mandelate racemase/muconate lactonizing enzyme family protein [Pelagicoccus mobilis]
MSRVAKIETYTLTLPRDGETLYLGDQKSGESENARGYFVRKGNRTVYPTVDRSILLRLETTDGIVAWGETYGLVAPRATMALIDDFLADFVIGRDPFDAAVIHEDLYNMMRVRGYNGGFYLDALAAIDIALWDAAGKVAGLPVAKLLGGRRHDEVSGYVSGLPGATLEERAGLAKSWQEKGFNRFKFAAPQADEDLGQEMDSLRTTLGKDAKIACDMHWTNSSAEAIAKIKSMEPYGLWFAEAPVDPEDVKGLARVAAGVGCPIGVGEEWRTVYDAQLRIDAQGVDIVQPEMGHTGITQFMRIGQAAQSRNLKILPHATIGSGVFLAASLQASSALENVVGHEFQHTVLKRSSSLVTNGVVCEEGMFRISDTPGIGLEPTEETISKLEK